MEPWVVAGVQYDAANGVPSTGTARGVPSTGSAPGVPSTGRALGVPSTGTAQGVPDAPCTRARGTHVHPHLARSRRRASACRRHLVPRPNGAPVLVDVVDQLALISARGSILGTV